MRLSRSALLTLLTATLATLTMTAGGAANASAQQSPREEGYFMLRNDNGFCLSVDGGKTTPAAIVTQNFCNPNNLDQWWQARQDADTTWVVNYKSQLCLSPNAGILRDVQYIEQQTCSSEITQKWNFSRDDGDIILLDRKGSNFAVSVHQPVNSPGSRVMLYHFQNHNSPDQHWNYYYGG